MCWTNIEAIQLIAKRKIPVFKLCLKITDSCVSSIVFGSMYNLNHVYTLEEELTVIPFGKEVIINEGFHSYSTRCLMENNPESVFVTVSNKLNDLDYYFKYPNLCKVIGYIPKGAIYYINKDQEIVSNAICLTEIQPAYVLDEQ